MLANNNATTTTNNMLAKILLPNVTSNSNSSQHQDNKLAQLCEDEFTMRSPQHRGSFSHQYQSKRLSLIDRGKSWAKQLMRINKLSNLGN